MNRRQALLLGFAGLGFVLAWPAHAAFDYREDGLVRVRQDDGEGRAAARREQRDERRAKGDQKRQAREAARYNEPDGYGYGYERRQQEHAPRDDQDRGRRR